MVSQRDFEQYKAHTRKGLEPRTFFEEMAQEGALLDFVRTYLPERMGDDYFRREIFDLVFRYAKVNQQDAMVALTYELHTCLDYFLSYTHPCRTKT